MRGLRAEDFAFERRVWVQKVRVAVRTVRVCLGMGVRVAGNVCDVV